ncbi:MAG TPA: TylF/MycF/NovP-related O-methyltransferase, partial [Gemmatimonadales bacterium]|nr:TylF/MycF/NovP-related O-methyltransferase [Gemmatimonadales bacterium]
MSGIFSSFERWFRKDKPAPEPFPRDFEPADVETWQAVSPFTMTSPERIYALRAAVRYVVQSRIPGDVVECGVWKGGSMMAVARTLLELGERSRHLYLFDTFEGMPAPTEADVDYAGEGAQAKLERSRKDARVWAIAPLEGVRQAVLSGGYDPDRVHFVQGKVEDTIPD